MYSRPGYRLAIHIESLAGSRERRIRLTAQDHDGVVVEMAMGLAEWRTVEAAVNEELRKADLRDDIIDIGARVVKKGEE